MATKDGISRREVVAMTAGAAGYAMSSLSGSAQGPSGTPRSTTDSHSTAAPLEDPKAKYPKPPYPSQEQPWPGLASKMNPRPDHGEKSYKGSGRLAGRKALITGGDSGMGRATAIAYAREGADVAISYYPTEEPDANEVIKLITAEGCKAVSLPGDLRDENYCKQLIAKAVEQLGNHRVVILPVVSRLHRVS